MAYVKNCNPGKITMDLPRANYIYELPLLSFADMYGDFNLSLIFNRQMKDSGEDPFLIQTGYKLNVQKRIIFEDGIPKFLQEENGKCVALYGPDGWPYAFDDDSQRVLRQTGNIASPYMIENADYSREYYNSNGMILSVYDKYGPNGADGTQILSFSYHTNKLATIRYRSSKFVTFVYDEESNLLTTITYTGANCVTSFDYVNANKITVTHYSGEEYTLTYSASGSQEFSAVASSVSCATKLQRGSNSMSISEFIGNNTVNTVTYTFPDAISNSTSNFSQVEITNNEGVKTRIQYKDGKMMYAYEVTGSDVTFSTITPKKYYGSVQIYKTIDDMGADDFGEPEAENVAESAYSAKHVREYGPLEMNDGIPMQIDDASMQRWYYDASVYSNRTGYKGYHLLTGWAKKKVMENAEHYNADICISNGLQETLIDFKINFISDSQWQFFAYKFQMPANYIYVRPKDTNQVELKDLRLTFEPTTTVEDGHTTHIGVSEYVLICPDGVYAPICNAQFDYGNVDISSYGQIYFEDLLRYKINKVKGVYANEVYCNKCKEALAVNNSGPYTVSYNGKSYNLDDCKLGVLQYTISKTVITEISENITQKKLTYRTFYKDSNNNEVVISSRELNAYLDVVSETADGVTTTYTRNSKGLLTYENVPNLYTAGIAYDTQNYTIAVTDEFSKVTTYTLDPIWGGVKSVAFPDETVVTDEYDDDMCALTKRIFGNATGRFNSLAYSNGNLSGLETGSLGYDFTYTKGKLTAVSKNDTKVEEHVHTGNTKTNSYYPSQSSALHSAEAKFDKYGRLTDITDVLANVYDIAPTFSSSTGAMTAIGNNSRAFLAKTTDAIRGEVARFTYDQYNRVLSKKEVTSSSDFATKVSKETFTYDDINRMTTDICIYDQPNGKQVTSTITYATTTTNPLADGRVGTYNYAVKNSSTAKTQNTFDNYKRVSKKAYTIAGKAYTKTLTYNKTRISKEADTAGITNTYTYDELGRISKLISGGKTTTYHYDTYGQLVREDNQALDATFDYVYNSIGNLTSIKKYAYTLASSDPSGSCTTTSFGYTNDKLTTFGGATIAYNSMGCPTTYEGKSLTWTRGKLSRMFSGTVATGTSSYNFTYNAYGQRVGKTYTYLPGKSATPQVGQLTASNCTYYYDHAGRLIAQETANTNYQIGESSEKIVFLYDESSIIGMVRTVNGTANTYYFHRNLLGDVVAIYDTSGNMVAKYLYDAWGNCTISSETTNTAVANANPIRYRGYYYDDDTGLYYCNARYYSPKWRRFISPDDTSYLDPESVNGLNLYCYCGNDPVNYADPSGHWIETVFDLFSLGASVVEVVINPADPWAWAGLVGDAVDLLPFVTGVGEGVKAAKLVKYTDEMIDASHVTLKFAKATEYAKSFADGGEMLSDFRHVGKYGFTISDHVSGTRIHSIFMKGEALNALNKVDGIDHASRIIYELKPYNRRNFRNGVKQLRRYRDAALQKYDSLYSMVLVLY